MCVCGPFSRQAMWWGNCQPAGRRLNPGERGGRRRRAGPFFSADTLIETRGSREIKAARRLKERKRRLR